MRALLIRLSWLLSLLIASSASAVTGVSRRRSTVVCLAIIAALNLSAIRSAQGIAYSFVDLTPTGWDPAGFDALAFGISGGQQVGVGYGPTTTYNHSHALLWSGSAATAVDLNPGGPTGDSEALGISGGQQVGDVLVTSPYGNHTHALLWSGTAASAVDLNPAGYIGSSASAISGGQEVGYGSVETGGPYPGYANHALLWSGTAASAVDLNPAGFTSSQANGISGGQQVGYGTTTSNDYHALLWSGAAASAVDLHPAGFRDSRAFSISGGQEVGWGDHSVGGTTDALLWSGSAGSVVDLQNYLSSNYYNSKAVGIDSNGNIVGYASFLPGGVPHAIEWVVVPEPSTGLLVIAGLLGLASWRRARA